METARLVKMVERWIASDPDPQTKQELELLIQNECFQELADRFRGRLQFGTAGLRGELGAGPTRMNRLVVRQTSIGLANYLLANVSQAASRGIVIGYDARKFSREFAWETAAVFFQLGFQVHYFEKPVPTPLVAFSILQLQTAGGVMITASHNPPQYNGYKVYWENGAQILQPHDQGISAKIMQAAQSNEPLFFSTPGFNPDSTLDEDMRDKYFQSLKTLMPGSLAGPLKVVYTPLHGVGGPWACQGLAQIGCTSFHPVESQYQPDGGFPSIAFPNPEEKDTLKLALDLAKELQADVVLANDPDGDRLAVAIPNNMDHSSSYLQLSGDQVGILLAYYLLTQKSAGKNRLVLNTVVSSSLLSIMAAQLGVTCEQTLTGFKWLANRAGELKREKGLQLVIAYEEALGYCVGELVHDKDGITAAMVFAELVAFLKAKGKSVLNYLEEIYRRFGLFISLQHSIDLPANSSGKCEQIEQWMDYLRLQPPTQLGEWSILFVDDYFNRTRRQGEKFDAISLPQTNMVALYLEKRGGQVGKEHGRIMVRPSGTEPKLKFYFELREEILEHESMKQAQSRAQMQISILADCLFSTTLSWAR